MIVFDSLSGVQPCAHCPATEWTHAVEETWLAQNAMMSLTADANVVLPHAPVATLLQISNAALERALTIRLQGSGPIEAKP